MRSMQWQLGILGTISAFAFRHRETKKNLCRDDRSRDLPNTDFQPAVRYLKKKKKQCPHSTTNTLKITTHTRQLEHYTRSTNNNYTKDNLKQSTKHTRQIRILQQMQKVKKLRTGWSGVLIPMEGKTGFLKYSTPSLGSTQSPVPSVPKNLTGGKMAAKCLRFDSIQRRS